MIPYARLRPGPGFSLGRAGFYYAQRLATRPVVRRSVSRAVASVIRLRHDPDAWPAADPRYAQVPSTLRQQGIAMLPGLVGPDVAAGILASLADKDLVGPGGRLTSLADLPPGARMAAYPLRTLLESSAIMALANAAPVLRIAAAYLGCKPTLSSLGVRWSFPGGGAGDTQQFHRDPDDWKFLKLFVYLSDVDAGCGPHVYVPRSHRTAGQVRARPYTQSEIERRYGKDGTRAVLGPQGTAFIADTYGIHAGMVPTRTPRLILQAQYSLLPVLAFRYDPIAVPGASGLDPYVNRLLVESRPSPGS